MGNEKNLIPNSMRTPKELREMAVKGGIRSGEVRRHNRTFKEALNWYLEMPVSPNNDTDREFLQRFPNLTQREYLAISAVEAAIKNKDVRAMVFARDTSGEIPTQTVALEQSKPFEINIKTID